MRCLSKRVAAPRTARISNCKPKQMRIKLYLMLAIVIAICGACRKSAGNQNSNANAPAPLQETVGGGAAPVGEKFNFRGLIASLKIEMTLVRDGERLTGTYLYPRVGKNIDLSGSIDSTGNVDLRETDETGKQSGVFKGKWKTNEAGLIEIEGKWSRPDGSKETEFHLGQQPFEFSSAHVSTKLIRETNKEAPYSIDAEYPQIDGDARFNGFNQQARALITKDVAAFKTAESQPADETAETLATEALTSTLFIFYDFHMATDDLISLEFTESEYSRGAAHGNTLTVVLNYDVKNNKRVELSDLFNAKSNYLNVISSYCIKDLKEQGKKNDMLLEDQIQEGAAARADNYKAWTIARKGLWITFDPYQVAAYAAGQQHVLVPYSALKDITKTDGPIGKFAG